MMTETIETERLILRPLAPEDAAPCARMLAEWPVIRWLTSPPWPYTLQDARDFIAGDGAAHSLAITRDGEFCGVIGIDGELGYWLGRPHHGQGLMTEAARAVVARHFAAGHERLVSGYLPGNAASARVLSKLGFRPADRVRRLSRPLGGEVTLQRVVLERAQWEAGHAD